MWIDRNNSREVKAEEYNIFRIIKNITKSNGVKSQERYFIKRPQRYTTATEAVASASAEAVE